MPKVATDTSVSSITGRNGTYTLTALEFETFNNLCRINGYGKRGEEIRGGMIVDYPSLWSLCVTFLKEQGYEVNLIPMSRRVA